MVFDKTNNANAGTTGQPGYDSTTGTNAPHHHGPNHPAAAGAGIGAGAGAAEHLRERHEGERAHGQHAGIAGNHPTAEGTAVGAGIGTGVGAVERHRDQKAAAAANDPAAGATSGAPGTGQKMMGRVEQAAGHVINNDTMKARGMQREGQGNARDNLGANMAGGNAPAGGVSGY